MGSRQAATCLAMSRRAAGADPPAHRRVPRPGGQPSGRTPSFDVYPVRPILGATEGAAWDRARRILASVQQPGDPTGFGNAKKPLDHSARRLLDFAAAGETHDERLWMQIAEATGAMGNTSCLVGTPEQVARALLDISASSASTRS